MAPVYKEGGLSQSQLCDQFNIDGSNLARKARKVEQTSQEYLEKRTQVLPDSGGFTLTQLHREGQSKQP